MRFMNIGFFGKKEIKMQHVNYKGSCPISQMFDKIHLLQTHSRSSLSFSGFNWNKKLTLRHQVRLRPRWCARRWRESPSGAAWPVLTTPSTRLCFTSTSKASTLSPKATPAPIAANFAPPGMHSDVTFPGNTIRSKRTFCFNSLKTDYHNLLNLHFHRQLPWRQKC